MEIIQTQLLLFFVLLFFSFTTISTGSSHFSILDVFANKVRRHGHDDQHRHHSSVKLFAFGDSYADTGNWGRFGASWNQPYGSTYPGKPAGRFSDGRILTDYIASHFGMISPIPFKMRRSVNSSQLQYGMNFAYGGTGVFNTLVNEPNMTLQINYFQQQIEANVFTKQDLNSSIALVSVAGNDYGTYINTNDINNVQAFQNFTKIVIQQVMLNLKHLLDLGMKKIAVTTVVPMGCLPNSAASSSYQNCSETFNAAAVYHNVMLANEVQKLKRENKDSVIFLLDLYAAFMSALKRNGKVLGNADFKTLLEPCCAGVDQNYYCGSVDTSGVKKYSVCKHPESSFFWDNVHPSQNGWKAVYSALRSVLDKLNS